MELKFEAPEAAQSAYNVFSQIMGGEPAWEGLALERQAPWLLIAQQAERLLKGLEGNSYAHCGYELMRLHVPHEERTGALQVWNLMPKKARLAWEAVARHLWMLHDSDSVRSLADAEAVWPDWYRKASQKKEPE